MTMIDNAPTITATTIAWEVGTASVVFDNVALFALKDDARAVLEHVLVKVTANGVELVATDSYGLVMAEGNHQDKGGPEGSYMVPASAFVAAAKLARSTKRGVITLTCEGQKFTFATNDGQFTGPLCEGEFVSYERLVPAPSDSIITDPFAFSTIQLSRLGKIKPLVPGCKGAVIGVKFQSVSRDKASLILVPSAGLKIVVMPTRI